ncbi:riboflavin synthase [Candidatus Falkowbacteria bacterium]|nr:riboflavin synthase [Candidatus Falkowbacteria bacterium]MBT4433390.1 riboflavin synthase [Candidatus Falkowbacteria bacterium]
MFSGIVEKTGQIKKIENLKDKVYFTIEADNFLDDIKIGASISCDGVCLTVVKKTSNDFIAELMPETLRLTKFQDSKKGDLINLEKSLKVGGRLDGHFVMGHVDGVGEVKKIEQDKEYINLIINTPTELIKFLAYKGSVSINGVSLTISGVGKDWFKVSLITHTLEITNLSEFKKGDKINLEVDMIARYLYQFKNF